MNRNRWTFVLALLCIVAFGCSQDGGSGFTENPVAPAAVTSVTAEARQGRVVICHHDVDDEEPYDSIAIEVNGNSVAKHFANQADCFTEDPVGTENCTCLEQ
jgi:hypothetical protein